MARNDHPFFRLVTRRDGATCADPACGCPATILTPADPALRLVDAVRLTAAGLLAVCPAHAHQRARKTAAAQALAAAQLPLFTIPSGGTST
ncbi:hypothetical protein [Streptomyces sp. NPDC059708]|uniref:hypothetical protein n=1 Tax=Streptomyces sp. NPDC059708 TaxID=3346916 RepID=UPI00367B84EA